MGGGGVGVGVGGWGVGKFYRYLISKTYLICRTPIHKKVLNLRQEIVLNFRFRLS